MKRGGNFYSFNDHTLQYQANVGKTNKLYDFKDKALSIRASSIKLTKEGFFYLSKIENQQVISFFELTTQTSSLVFAIDIVR